MKIARKLGEGIASWLHFETQCGRTSLFNEKYMSYPIGQILTSHFGRNVFAEVDHPTLTAHAVGQGKRPKIDFAVMNPYPNITIAIESKWIGKTDIKVEDIIWDLIRLELIAANQGANTYFILGGQHKKLRKLFDSKAFLAEQTNRSPRPILKTEKYRTMGLKLDNPPISRINTIKKVVNKYPKLEMPSWIKSGKPYYYPEKCNQNTNQIYVWEISSRKNRETFIPSEHKYYS